MVVCVCRPQSPKSEMQKRAFQRNREALKEEMATDARLSSLYQRKAADVSKEMGPPAATSPCPGANRCWYYEANHVPRANAPKYFVCLSNDDSVICEGRLQILQPSGMHSSRGPVKTVVPRPAGSQVQ